MGLAILLFVVALFFGLVLAAMVSVLAFGVGALLTRGVERGRGSFLAVTALFPFLCVAWMAATYVGHGAVNVLVFERGLRLGDEFDCPLPNGYSRYLEKGSLEAGTLYRPAGWPRWPNGWKDGIRDVRLLQLANGHVLGGRGRRVFETPEAGDRIVESYFLLETSSGRKTESETLPELEKAAGQLGLRLQLRAIGEVYSAYGRTWFDGVLIWIMLLPLALGALGMVRWLGRLRARRG